MRAKTKVNLDSFFLKVNGDKERILRLRDGNWFLTGFIKFQWFNKKDGFDLALSNKLHASIYNELKKYSVPLKKVRGLQEVLETSKEKEKEIIKKEEPKKNEAIHQGIVPDMVDKFKFYFPNYFFFKENDFPAALSIAHNIAVSKGWTKASATAERRQDVLKIWNDYLEFISQDKWFSAKEIAFISKNWQSVVQGFSAYKKTQPITNGSDRTEREKLKQKAKQLLDSAK